MSSNGGFVNPKDPLKGTVQPRAEDLFHIMSKTCHGFSAEAVLDAASNVLLNALRQTYGSRSAAERAFDERMGKLKGILLERHYDPVTGKRRNVFPHTQVVEVPHFIDKDR